MTSELCVQLLGGFDVTHGKERLDTFTSPRLQSLLAFLLLHRDAPQSRQQLAFTFWPDSTESQARTNLRKLLYDLRQVLPEADAFVHADDHTIRWRVDAPYRLDVAAFEEALAEAEQAAERHEAQVRQTIERAVNLYHGDLLPGCYDDWIVPERARLRARYLGALEQLAELLEQARDIHAAIETAQHLLRHDPLHEPAYRRLMRLHAAQGDRAGALHVYHTCVTVLERELGVEPGEATQRAHQRLLETEAAPLAVDTALPEADVPTQPAVAPRPEAARLPGLVASVPLVGRHPEWAQLVAAWQQAARGEPHALLVEGEAGIGKSRLASELARWLARQGIRTAAARCYAAEGALPYAPVVAWLRALPFPALEPTWMSELARLLPELLDGHPELSPPGSMAEPWQRQRLFEALAHAVLGARDPLLLLLDDLQWCDSDTREWLHYLLRYDSQAPMLLLGTVRSEELGEAHPLVAWTQALHHDGKITEVELERLDEEDTLDLAEQVAAHDLAPELASCIHRETGGNPLYVVEMVRAGLAVDELEPLCPLQELPPRIQGAIEARLGQLSQQGRALAEAAAVVGRGFSLALLLAATSMEEDAVIVGLDELWQRRVVLEQGEAAYDFTHDKLREVAYAELSPVRRRALHARVAEALEGLYSDDLDPVASEIAAHHDEAGQPEQAIPYYLRAAEVARRVYASEEATHDYERALALADGVSSRQEEGEWRFAALCGLGEVALHIGRLNEVEAHVQAAIDLAERGGMPRQRLVRPYYCLARAYAAQERFDELIRIGREQLRSIEGDEPSIEVALIYHVIGMGHNQLAEAQQYRERMARAAALLERLPYNSALSQVYGSVVEALVHGKKVDEAARWSRMLRQEATLHGDLDTLIQMHRVEGTWLSFQGDMEAAQHELERAVQVSEEAGAFDERRMQLTVLGFLYLNRGSLEAAEACVQRGVESGDVFGRRRHTVWMTQLLALVRYGQGRWREAMHTAEGASAMAQQAGRYETETLAHQLLGRVDIALGENARALAHFQDAAANIAPHVARPWRAWLRFPYPRVLAEVLSGLETAYCDPAAFRSYCDELRALSDAAQSGRRHVEQHMAAVGQWFLEPARPQDLRGFGKPRRSTSPGWTWTDPYDDCSYTLDEGLEIRAALGRDLWHINLSAPRLTRSVSDDLAIEATVVPARKDRLAIGGVLMWLDEQNYLRLDVGARDPNEIHFGGCLDNEDRYLGRGQLPPPEYAEGNVSDRVSPVHLRMERVGGQVRALCSRDGETWFSAGQVHFREGEVQVGLHAIGNIDRTVYSGVHTEGTAVRFTSVQVWGA